MLKPLFRSSVESDGFNLGLAVPWSASCDFFEERREEFSDLTDVSALPPSSLPLSLT